MKITFFCNHQFDSVNDLGYQYCKKCNKAIFVGSPEHVCTWKIIDRFAVHYWNKPDPTYYKYVLQCKTCGEITFKNSI